MSRMRNRVAVFDTFVSLLPLIKRYFELDGLLKPVRS